MGKGGRAQGEPSKASAGRVRCTELEYESRLAEAAEYMLRGWADKRVAAEMAHKYGVTTEQGRNYIRDVKARWAEEARARSEAPAEDILKEHIDRFKMLMEMSVREKSMKTAIMAAERLAQLEGLLTTKSVQHSGKVGLDLNPEVDAAAAEVLRQRGWAPPDETPKPDDAGEPEAG